MEQEPPRLLGAAHTCSQTQPEHTLLWHNSLLGLSKAMLLSHKKEQLGTHSRLHLPSPKALCVTCRAEPQGFCSGAAQTEGDGQLAESRCVLGLLVCGGVGWLLCDSRALEPRGRDAQRWEPVFVQLCVFSMICAVFRRLDRGMCRSQKGGIEISQFGGLHKSTEAS